MTKKYDLAILGSGSAAFAAALKASELGAKVLLTEFDEIGGTCVNRGCIPTKNLIEASIIYRKLVKDFPGIDVKVSLNFASLIAQKDELVSELRHAKYISVAENDENMDLVKGKAYFASTSEIKVNGEKYEAEKFIIATGARPAVPPIKGLEEAGYLTSRTIFQLDELPESLIIIGGGYIALEIGQLFSRLGSEVTILERSQRILRRAEPVISEYLRKYMEEDGIAVYTSASISEVSRAGDVKEVVISVRNETIRLKTEQILVAAGRKPNSENLGLEKVGVETDERGFIRVNQELRAAPNVWAAGDVIGEPMATPVAAKEGIVAAENAVAGKHRVMNYETIPRAIFTHPEVGIVGFTEEEAVKAGYTCACRSLLMRDVPKARAIREERGIIKMVTDAQTKRIIGVHMLGDRAADVIHEAALAIKHRMTIDDLIDMVHIYPTMSEAVRMVAQMFYKDVTKLSCCAE
jgi:mercuric reductase